MRKIAVLIAVLGTTLLPVLCTVPAHAQATRTWVSGVGDDANPCSRTAPCLTFAGAITKTAAGGEIDALDPGGFGTLTITKSITIDGGGGSCLGDGVVGHNWNNCFGRSDRHRDDSERAGAGRSWQRQQPQHRRLQRHSVQLRARCFPSTIARLTDSAAMASTQLRRPTRY